MATIPSNSVSVTCTAPVNIAVIKYWGKRDEKLILPINSSISGTIDQSSMRSKTTIIASKDFDEDSMTLNGKDEKFKQSKRLNAVYEAVRAQAGDYLDENGNVLIKKEDWSQYKIQVTSDNNFPTAAGLASSASGLACFASCLAALYNYKPTFDEQLSAVARLGSGSACRSLYGGWGKWNKGTKDDGSDSYAVQVADENHWPEMRVLILVAHGGQKEVPSTSGMETSVKTSELLTHRAEHIVEARCAAMGKAILDKDFTSFAELTMKDSNQFHAVCLDTYPPIFYLNQTSKRIIDVCHRLNDLSMKNGQPPVVAYTFDAGPNAVLYCLDENLNKLTALFTNMFLPEDKTPQQWCTDPAALTFIGKNETIPSTEAEWQAASHKIAGDHVYNVFVSKLGPGPLLFDQKHTFGQ